VRTSWWWRQLQQRWNNKEIQNFSPWSHPRLEPCESARHVRTPRDRPVLPCVMASGHSLSLPLLKRLSPAADLLPGHVHCVQRSATVSGGPAVHNTTTTLVTVSTLLHNCSLHNVLIAIHGDSLKTAKTMHVHITLHYQSSRAFAISGPMCWNSLLSAPKSSSLQPERFWRQLSE